MDKFELESRIMDCWSVVDDLKVVVRMGDHRPVSEDELLNVLIGLQTLYQMKFEQLWATFERSDQKDYNSLLRDDHSPLHSDGC